MKKIILIATAAVLTLFGCQKEGYESKLPDGKGAVSIALERSGEFTIPVIKSEDVSVDGFYVRILKGEVVVSSFNRYSDVPSSVELTPGVYTIEAGSHRNDPAAFDQPIFYGSGEFTVAAGKILPVNVVCTLQNMKVTVGYTEKFGREMMENFEVAVTNGTGNLVFTKTIIDNGSSGYFSPGSLTIKLNGYRKVTGEEILHTIEIPDGKAQDHFILDFDAVETGEIDLGVSGNDCIILDWSVNNKNHGVIIPGEGEEILPDEGGNQGGGNGGGTEGGENPPVGPVEEYLPTITGDGIGTPVEISKTASDEELEAIVVEINISTLNNKTIEDILVTITSDPEELQSAAAAMGLSGTFSIVDFSDAGGTDRKSLLIELGLINDPAVDPIKGVKSEHLFPISKFMSALAAVAEPGICNFNVKVIDSEGKEASADCVVKIVQ